MRRAKAVGSHDEAFDDRLPRTIQSSEHSYLSVFKHSTGLEPRDANLNKAKMERSGNDQMCSNGYDSKMLNDDYFESTFGSTPVDTPNRIDAEFCSSIRYDNIPLSLNRFDWNAGVTLFPLSFATIRRSKLKMIAPQVRTF